MYTQMLTSKKGGELISFKVNGEEKKIHQGEQCMDENGKKYIGKRHSPVLFPIVGKLKKKSNTNWWKNL